MNPVHLIALVGMNFLWAATYSCFKLLEPFLSSGQLVTVRFALAAGGLLLIWPWLPGRAPRGQDLWRAMAMGVVVFAIGPRLQVEGVQRGKAGDSALLVALEPLITSVAAGWFLREKIPPQRWFGFALGVLGVFLVARIWDPRFQPIRGLTANLLFASSFICETAYSIMGKPLLNRSGLAKLIGVALLSATAANLAVDGPSAAAVLPRLPGSMWCLLVYLAWICTLGGYLLWYVVIRDADVSLIALTIFIQPLAGLALSIVLVGESLHWGQLWGSIAIVLGLLVGLRRKSSPKNVPPPN